jgi:hypothetical protein
MKNITVFLLFFVSAVAFAQGGGTYLPPDGSDLRNWQAKLKIDCSSAKPQVGAFGGPEDQLSIVGLTFDASGSKGELNILEIGSEVSQGGTMEVDAGNQIWIKNNRGGGSMEFGQYSDPDVAAYCQALASWNAQLPHMGAAPLPIIPIQLLPWLHVKLWRTEMSDCAKNQGAIGYSRSLNYYVNLFDSSGENEDFYVKKELSFGSLSECQGWSETPWVSGK